MNKLANSLGSASREIALGAPQSVIKGVADYFTRKGLKVQVVDEDDCAKEESDVIIYQIDWEKASVYLSPFKADGYCPNVTISVNCLSPEKGLDQIVGFLEAIQF